MKLSPLRSKKGLRPSPLKRKSRLKRMSPQKSAMTKPYKVSKDSFGDHVRSAMSGLLLHRSQAEPHHVFGRQKNFILAFLWLSKHEHERVHRFGKQSRKLGWLQPSFDGQPYDPNYTRPWSVEFEQHFPEEYKRPK